MLLRRITDFILQGRINAIGAAFVCSSITAIKSSSVGIFVVVSIVSGLSAVIAGFVTLRKGALEGLYVLLASLLPYVLGYMLHPEMYQPEIVLISMLLIIASNVLTWFGAVLLRYYASWSITLQLIALLFIACVGLIHLIQPDLANWWGLQLTAGFDRALQGSGLIDPKDIATEKVAIEDAVNHSKLFATRIAMFLVWINGIVQLLIARWWQATMFNPGGLRKELYEIRISYVLGVLFLIGLLAGFWQFEFVNDAMMVLYLTLGMAGLSLLHRFAASLEMGWILLVVIYTLAPITMIFFPFVGLLDIWMNFRKRIANKV